MSNKKKKKPNILILMVDQQRYPAVYETNEVKKWCEENLCAQQMLKKNGMVFTNHYAASTACSPSRTTLYTGQYPSLHGVTQTTGVAKGAFDPDVFWLDANTVPTMGHYFRTAGYETFWKGKWHASDEDIFIPGTHDAYSSYNLDTGVPEKDKVKMYKQANRLDAFGFSGWIGPEPHGTDPRNSASSAATGMSGRDQVYAEDTVKLLQALDKKSQKEEGHKPWFVMCSLVNPHDIALYGVLTAVQPNYHFEVDQTLPFIPPAPTVEESLSTKPRAQESYRYTYPRALQPIIDNNFYRQLYYSLQKKADQEMEKVLKALQQSSFYEDTIVLFTSDHGELLGAHGGLHQKWYNMYEESIHVPLIIHNPLLFNEPEETGMLTSHVDVLPTLLGLAGVKVEKVQAKLSKNHTEVRPLVGRDLSKLIKGSNEFHEADEPIYFMTDDDVTRGLNQTTARGEPYQSVLQPNHIEAVIATLPSGKGSKKEVWKYARYFDIPQSDGDQERKHVLDEFELYNLTQDPLEEKNLAHPQYATELTGRIQKVLSAILAEQSKQKRLVPKKSG
ncbi:sulfatase [Alkalihalophilus pseudofirmus OF4]|uniref:Sulfatase n=1 Tax=Alkalihalophilus pseudofirmus (strain ATCC BAA-2126 / JCM 17055 / OF4) TaxID=398511 RepID=D3FTJ2_ALKPO|nr:sulfatase-like hydrolase/transferase [Alkalihalophilus pseudofirmus]ADC50065.1 sulfatase [Alkalihalophilus pseudofirmus OF4]